MLRRALVLGLPVLLAVSTARAFVWPTTIERVEHGLTSAEPSERQRAAEQLVDLPAPLARRLVLKALDDTDTQVRLLAADAARQLRVPGAGEHVIGWLNDSERRVRVAAAEVLRTSPTERAVSQLGRVLGDPDVEVRIAAAEALANAGRSEAALALLGHLDDSSPQVRRAVVMALGVLGDKRAVVPLIGKIQDAQPQVRRAVAHTLGELGERRATAVLILALRDPDESVRSEALGALGELRDPEAVSSVSASVEHDTSSAVKAAALDTLGRIGSSEAVTALSKALSGDDAELTEAARAALVRVGEPAVPRLIDCLGGQPPPSVADQCAMALGELHAKRAGAVITSALDRGVVSVRGGLLALGSLADPANLPTVLERLTESDPLVRKSAIEAALALLDPAHPDGRAVEPIARGLERARQSRAERLLLVALLGRTGSPRAVPWLLPLISDSDDIELRAVAIEALGSLGRAGQDVRLLPALEDQEPSVRLAAALALNRSASRAIAQPLLDRLEHRAEQDRPALVLALAGALSQASDPALLERASRLVEHARDAERDALIEAIGRFPGEPAAARLTTLLGRSPAVADRAKLAEVLGAYPGAQRELERLARDPDGAVRANAVWSLGSSTQAGTRATLERALADRDVSVSSNAAAALARLAIRHRLPVVSSLCRALSDWRSYVRANALSALALVGQRCAAMDERALLRSDPAELVRQAAARLVFRVPGRDAAADRAALRRCAAEDPSGSVAAACADRVPSVKSGQEPVTVYVVPMGETLPKPRAPFAILFENGLMRLGTSDRRGAVFEPAAPSGSVSLLVPAALER